MRTFTLLFSALALSTAVQAQTVAKFEDLTLSKPDTFYVNYTSSGNDVGFNDGLAHFPCVYDTDFGGYWDYGFAYSNMTDSVTSGYTNGYSAKTAIGYDSSANYVVSYGGQNTLPLRGVAIGEPVAGMYVTNSTYAYNSMRDGDAFAKKFGGPTGNDPDWFKLTVKGMRNGQLTTDSVDFYLADYRFADNDSDYLVKTWQWVNLLPLGHVDSLQFSLSSTDTAGGLGMNTPAYFCLDNFTTNETDEAVKNVPAFIAKVYPNPATNMLYIDLSGNSVQQATVYDVTGKLVGNYAITGSSLAINTASLPAGMYVLQLAGNDKTATVRFVKQ